MLEDFVVERQPGLTSSGADWTFCRSGLVREIPAAENASGDVASLISQRI